MVRVVVIDDEALVRKGIMSCLNWEDYGISMIGEAADGKSGLQLVRSLQPDIVLTDIKMPVMNGLEMTKIIRQEFPHINILILSVLEDFPYVREALQLGVVDYVQKLLMVPEDLLKALLKIKDSMRNNEADKPIVQRPEAHNITYLFDFWNWLQGNEQAEYKRDVNDEQAMYLIGKIMMNTKLIRKPELSNILAMLNNVFAPLHVDIGNDDKGDFWFLVTSSKEHENNATIAKAIDQLEQSVRKRSDDHPICAIGLSELFFQIDDRKIHYERVNLAIQLRFHDANRVIYKAEHIVPTKEVEGQFIHYDDLKQYLSLIESLNENDSLECLHRLFPESIDPSISPEWVRDGIYQWLSAVIQLLEEWGCFLQGAFDFKSPYNKVSRFQTYEELRNWCLRVHIVALDMLSKTKSSYNRYEIEKAIEYTKEHYAKPIRVQEVANWVNLSENYFSNVFAKEMGITYVQFLQEFRIEKAKELLRSRQLNWIEVGEAVGFNDPKYFSTIFKKHTDLTPLQFMNHKSRLEQHVQQQT